jgi:general secretion pathway protein A
MYTGFFGLREKPFAITPDPRYLFLSERHAEALAHLLYGISEAGGFVQLTGEVGTGKTTIVRSLLGQIPKDAEVALILNPRITPAEFLLTICEELALYVRDADRGSVKELVDTLNRHLLEAHAAGRRVVVIVDEAQNLSADVLEQVRLLTNLETPTQKLLQIILIGQPELRELLQRVELRQLAQRITGRYHLAPLTRPETAGYVRHRLGVAGSTAELFTPAALSEIHRLSRGIPRVINVVCDRTLLGAYTQEQHRATAGLVRQAAGEVYGRPIMPLWGRWVAAGSIATGVALLLFGGWQFLMQERSSTSPDSAPPRVAASSAPVATPAPAPAVRAAPAPPAQPPVAQLLRAHANETDPDTAFTRLFSLWGANYRANDADACVQAARQGLECIEQRGSWGQLRALNRPAILSLSDDAGFEHQVVLSELEDERAAVEIGGTRQPVGVADLSKYWYGDFLILWRPQVPGARQLSAGMRGNEVRWLRHSLEKVRGVAPSEGPADLFDDRLVRLVEDFQREHRLNVDGIVGVQTQIALDTALRDPQTPFLQSLAAPGS